ncbi:transcription factor PHYTOCHROME INTERACTING FACTOR-LIKE 15-like [Salvia divinorum]
MQAIKKRKRAALLHSHKKREDNRIKKRFWELRNLIPNCTQMDKESVLDEAIVYLKCLQLQLQIIPTYAGLCVPPTPITYPLQMYGLPLVGFNGYRTGLETPTPQQP